MIDLLDACEKVNKIFKRGGYLGIGEVKETIDSWIFSPSSEHLGEVEYGGLGPYLMNKSTGKIRNLDFIDDYDWKLMQTALTIDIPNRFLIKV